MVNFKIKNKKYKRYAKLRFYLFVSITSDEILYATQKYRRN